MAVTGRRTQLHATPGGSLIRWEFVLKWAFWGPLRRRRAVPLAAAPVNYVIGTEQTGAGALRVRKKASISSAAIGLLSK